MTNAASSEPDRGREAVRPPSLRTVRADLPHTALQSVVYLIGIGGPERRPAMAIAPPMKIVSITCNTVCPAKYTVPITSYKMFRCSHATNPWLTFLLSFNPKTLNANSFPGD